MKQTAIEWLVEHLNLDKTSPNYNELTINKAKAMEKEQRIQDYSVGYSNGQVDSNRTAEQYYNETFKSE